MKNKKETLIETLRGSIDHYRDLPRLIGENTIYDENGYVDVVFFTEILEWMAENASVTAQVGVALNRLLGIDESENDGRVRGKKTGGMKMSVEEVIWSCKLEGNIIRLPDVVIERKTYEEVKRRIEEIGGKWKGGKVQGFTFEFDATRVFNELKEKGRYDLKREFQFFSTPDHLADMLVEFSGEITSERKVLEPSGGTGSLIKAIHRKFPSVVVDCYEAMPENREILSKNVGNINIIGYDFLEHDPEKKYDIIIANPPFCKNQDVTHVLKMYEILNTGGTLASIMSCHWRYSEEKASKDFREFLDRVHAKIIDIDEGDFKESGTNIRTCAVVIVKKGVET